MQVIEDIKVNEIGGVCGVVWNPGQVKVVSFCLELASFLLWNEGLHPVQFCVNPLLEQLLRLPVSIDVLASLIDLNLQLGQSSSQVYIGSSICISPELRLSTHCPLQFLKQIVSQLDSTVHGVIEPNPRHGTPLLYDVLDTLDPQARPLLVADLGLQDGHQLMMVRILLLNEPYKFTLTGLNLLKLALLKSQLLIGLLQLGFGSVQQLGLLIQFLGLIGILLSELAPQAFQSLIETRFQVMSLLKLDALVQHRLLDLLLEGCSHQVEIGSGEVGSLGQRMQGHADLHGQTRQGGHSVGPLAVQRSLNLLLGGLVPPLPLRRHLHLHSGDGLFLLGFARLGGPSRLLVEVHLQLLQVFPEVHQCLLGFHGLLHLFQLLG